MNPTANLGDRYPIHNQLLRLLLEHRFATTQQLARFTRASYRSHRSALRQTNRHLRTLAEQGLIVQLERRIGGWQGGSTTSIWALTTSGRQTLAGSRKGKRERPAQISTTFLGHLLAITETRLVLSELADTPGAPAISSQGEPDCWRGYLSSHGTTSTLKPDLALTVMSRQYTDHYFVEIDQATENPARVIRKCWQYQHYRRTGFEQDLLGAFPVVIWLVPHTQRRQQLERYIQTEPDLPQQLFRVITLDQLTALIRDGPPAN